MKAAYDARRSAEDGLERPCGWSSAPGHVERRDPGSTASGPVRRLRSGSRRACRRHRPSSASPVSRSTGISAGPVVPRRTTVQARAASGAPTSPSSAHQVIVSADAEQARAPRPPSRAPYRLRESPVAQDDGKRALADRLVLGMSRRLFATRIAHASAPTPTAPTHQAPAVHGLGLDVRRADDRDQAEEDEDADLAESAVAVRALATGVEPGGGDGHSARPGQQPPERGGREDEPGDAPRRRSETNAAVSFTRAGRGRLSPPAAEAPPGWRRCPGSRRSSRWRS